MRRRNQVSASPCGCGSCPRKRRESRRHRLYGRISRQQGWLHPFGASLDDTVDLPMPSMVMMPVVVMPVMMTPVPPMMAVSAIPPVAPMVSVVVPPMTPMGLLDLSVRRVHRLRKLLRRQHRGPTGLRSHSESQSDACCGDCDRALHDELSVLPACAQTLTRCGCNAR